MAKIIHFFCWFDERECESIMSWSKRLNDGLRIADLDGWIIRNGSWGEHRMEFQRQPFSIKTIVHIQFSVVDPPTDLWVARSSLHLQPTKHRRKKHSHLSEIYATTAAMPSAQVAFATAMIFTSQSTRLFQSACVSKKWFLQYRGYFSNNEILSHCALADLQLNARRNCALSSRLFFRKPIHCVGDFGLLSFCFCSLDFTLCGELSYDQPDVNPAHIRPVIQSWKCPTESCDTRAGPRIMIATNWEI